MADKSKFWSFLIKGKLLGVLKERQKGTVAAELFFGCGLESKT